MHIPIENIYFLLCYAWNKLDEKDRIKVDLDGNTKVIDLLTKVLISGTKVLLKRGIEKDYIRETVELPGIKGKLEVAATIKTGALKYQRTICSFDEFSSDVLINQILVTTLQRLLQTSSLEIKLKIEVKRLLSMFPPVKLIDLQISTFKKVRFHRNNRFYGLLINVCQLLHQHSLPSERKGEWHFMDFTRDENKMNQLFESFIFNFYKLEFPKWNVWRSEIKWKFETKDDKDHQYIPKMRTDITMQKDDQKIIIDAKYYRETMATNFNVEKIKSANLYQLFSYLLNQRDDSKKSLKAKGILIYPTTEKEYNLHYTYESHPIQIKTVNLNQHWSGIEGRLHYIIDQT